MRGWWAGSSAAGARGWRGWRCGTGLPTWRPSRSSPRCWARPRPTPPGGACGACCASGAPRRWRRAGCSCRCPGAWLGSSGAPTCSASASGPPSRLARGARAWPWRDGRAAATRRRRARLWSCGAEPWRGARRSCAPCGSAWCASASPSGSSCGGTGTRSTRRSSPRSAPSSAARTPRSTPSSGRPSPGGRAAPAARPRATRRTTTPTAPRRRRRAPRPRRSRRRPCASPRACTAAGSTCRRRSTSAWRGSTGGARRHTAACRTPPPPGARPPPSPRAAPSARRW
mmetsp:Transcript_27069/g.92412  ORF Transcript_27069/g.92412 Transcript_27069/m.92412 type:complete len:285 (-) Transcript_27069:465-1319(-)